MKQEITEKIIKLLYPNLNYEIIEYEILPRKRLDEKFNWVDDTNSVSIGIKRLEEFESPYEENISEVISNWTGKEYNIYIV